MILGVDGVESLEECGSASHGRHGSLWSDNILHLICDVLTSGVFLLITLHALADLGRQSGKSHFGYVYGFILLGTVSLHFILNLMSLTGINFLRTASVLGYCLLPLVLTSAVGIVLSLECLHTLSDVAD